MATIELYKSKINKMSETLDDLCSETDSYNSNLKLLSIQLLAVNNPILDKAISDISTASKIQEEQLNSLNDMQTKIDEFVETARRIDNNVAEYIRGLPKMYAPKYSSIKIGNPIIRLDTITECLSKANCCVNVMSYSKKVYTEEDFSSMSEEELINFAESLTNRIQSGSADYNDKIIVKNLEKCIKRYLFHNKKLFLSIYEKIYPQKMQLIREAISKRGNYDENWQLAIAYFMANGSSLSTSITLCRAEHFGHIVGDKYELMEFENGEGFEQGNFWIGNFDVSESKDGFCRIKAVAHQSPVAKSEGAVIVYDENERIIDAQVLNRYKNPTDFISSIKTIWKDWHGENYEETKIDISIPKGGYVQITDDPDVLQFVQGELFESKIKSSFLEEYKKNFESAQSLIGNDIEKIGYKDSLYTNYLNVLDTIDFYSEIAKQVCEITDDLETLFWTNQQKGSGSCYIYNH